MKHKINVLLMFCTCILAGCSSQSAVDTTINISSEAETDSQSEEESVPPERPAWLKETLLIEAGVKELSIENLVKKPCGHGVMITSHTQLHPATALPCGPGLMKGFINNLVIVLHIMPPMKYSLQGLESLI